jgi:hypothetical protein
MRYRGDMTIPFDTHAFVKKLTPAGVSEAQAEVHAEALGELVIERLATREDIAALKDELRALEERLEARIGTLEARIGTLVTKEELKDLELRLTLRFGAMLAAAVAVIAALVKLL